MKGSGFIRQMEAYSYISLLQIFLANESNKSKFTAEFYFVDGGHLATALSLVMQIQDCSGKDSVC